MDYYSHEEIASITLYDVRISEGELMVFESCIKYVVDNCPQDKLYQIIGCETREELDSFRKEPIELLVKYMQKEYLPVKYLHDEYLPHQADSSSGMVVQEFCLSQEPPERDPKTENNEQESIKHD